MAEHTSANRGNDGPRPDDDLIIYWVRAFDSWMAGSEHDAGRDQDRRSLERYRDSDTAA